LGQFHGGKEGVRIIRIIKRKEVDNHEGKEKDEVFSIVGEEGRRSKSIMYEDYLGYLGGRKCQISTGIMG
jgi:hypothetical protein